MTKTLAVPIGQNLGFDTEDFDELAFLRAEEKKRRIKLLMTRDNIEGIEATSKAEDWLIQEIDFDARRTKGPERFYCIHYKRDNKPNNNYTVNARVIGQLLDWQVTHTFLQKRIATTNDPSCCSVVTFYEIPKQVFVDTSVILAESLTAEFSTQYASPADLAKQLQSKLDQLKLQNPTLLDDISNQNPE